MNVRTFRLQSVALQPIAPFLLMESAQSGGAPPPYRKCYFVDQSDGGSINLGFMIHNSGSYKIVKLLTFINGENVARNHGIPLVSFFEMFANKLESKFYKVEPLIQGESISPRELACRQSLPEHVVSQICRINHGISIFPQHGKFVSSAVTKNEHFPKGILVTAHTTPIYGTQFGWTYSIRIKLVDDEGNNNRCQLVTRHWQIKKSSGRIENVSGAGVIGLFPVFHQGGFVHVGSHSSNHLQPSKKGEVFIYQSCTGSSSNHERTVSFGGSLTFRLVPPNEKREDHVEYQSASQQGFAGLGLFNVIVKPFPVGTAEDAIENGLI